MKLHKILNGIKILSCSCDIQTEIQDIVYDSRKIKKGNAYVCLSGFNYDGHKFAKKAIQNNAAVVISEKKLDLENLIVVENTRDALAKMSANFFDHPSEKILSIAITGTKGKTTTSWFIFNILNSANQKTALIGTFGFCLDGKITKTENTTPESYEIQKFLKISLDSGAKNIVLEASSLGLKNHRLDGILFDYAVFTNFSNDHIGTNEHEDIQDYLESKLLLFKNCKHAILNCDDPEFKRFQNSCKSEIKVKKFGFSKESDFLAEKFKLIFKSNKFGSEFFLNNENFFINIPGKFNVYNALAAISVCSEMKISKKIIKIVLSQTSLRGRSEIVPVGKNYTLIIDYAHNELSMKNIISSIREYNPKRIVTLFGAGGERSHERRFKMGEVSGKLSDLTVITEDNSRREPIDFIIKDIETGILRTEGKYVIIPNRRDAIKWCLDNAQNGDVIIMAGKGHETYQEINGVKRHFDEREIVKELIEG
ncbi:MAG: UDP-N-acetylmuramoyl-L-alanyl-D-glutamate--2,6-diaminopimelate ligase [Oscillospiraceae bacterium]|jgi:UDP-N-acetylmuramoyl-L-alanyl-D-glutamate--2,6-diaminopimelate ligase|nr:UDP-N-acetylmuramoyl-L-alanyl-D-glutamate--2,6-diaminopimelate ligase [Oscillospiraceae bacterium]